MADVDKENTVESKVDALTRERAYRLWENDEDPKKHADDYWYTARKQIEAEGIGESDTEPAVEQSDKQQREGIDPQEDLGLGEEGVAKPRAKRAR